MTTAAQHQRDIEKHTTQEWAMRYTMVKRSARLARIHARRTLTGWGWPGGVEDTVLVVCELVTNAIRHGRVAGHQLALRLALLECGGLVIDVSDPRPDFENFADALAQGADPTHHEQGRGLMVAARLGAEITWFVRQFCGKTVRARLTGTPGCRHCNGSLCKISQGRPQTGARGGTGGTDPTVTRAGRPSSGR